MIKSHKKKFPTLLTLLAALMLLGAVSVAQAQSTDSRLDRPVSAHVEGLKLQEPLTMPDAFSNFKIDPALGGAADVVQVLVRLEADALATAAADGVMSRGVESALSAQQAALIAQARALDPNTAVIGQSANALNAVMLRIDASALAALAESSDVLSISQIHDYELSLDETVPYIGGAALQDLGYDGTGISVAVLDSGVDYLHANLGGSGDPAEYAANDPNIIEPGTFPTAKVVGGFDFTGSTWAPGLDVTFDPDPLDDGPQAGHGTHVADIIGGVDGVAPGADIYAVKVCSSVSTSCSGVALIAAMDYILDPNGDGDFSDRVDIVNMSLGSNYGTAFDDDLSRAVENAAALGVLTVSSAGNGSDKPYITGTPSSSPSALAVAQTAVPSAVQPTMEVLTSSAAGTYFPVFQAWSVAPTEALEYPIQYADGAGNNLDGCAPFDGVDLSGYIVLVDRGGCNFTLKISNISQAGGEAGIIGLIAPGDPFNGGDGGDRPIDIPGYMIDQAESVAIQNAIASGEEVIALIDPAQGIGLVGTMIGSSSRGPAMGSNLLKPEIGAPGASVSAIAGSGTGEGPFGGTSGASPMVAGSAALLMQAYPDRSWAEIRAVLVNSAETDIRVGAEALGGQLAPISRIGGGEVRVDRALEAPIAIWEADSLSSVLSFGFEDASNITLMKKTVHVQNYTGERLTYRLSPEFRYASNNNGGVTVDVREYISVPAYGSTQFDVALRIRPFDLPAWVLDAGSAGANGDALTAVEYGGYINFDQVFNSSDDADPLHLAFHVLPRAAADVNLSRDSVSINNSYQGLPAGRARVTNTGWGAANIESYSLIATSDDLPEGGFGEQSPTPDFRYIGYATIPVPAGFCSGDASFLMQFAVNSWERQTNPIGVTYWFHLDVDQDPSTGDGPFGSEYSILNRDLSLNNVTDGRNVVFSIDWSTGASQAFFFTDHDTNSGNMVLTFCGEQVGMNAANFFQPMDVTAEATDFYYGGPGDVVSGMTISPLGEQYLGIFSNSEATTTTLGRGAAARLNVVDFGPLTNNTETGLLLLMRQGAEVEALTVEVE